MVPLAMATYGKLCGWTLARAHARSGDRIAIAAYLGNGDSFDRAIVEFSKAYAERTNATTRRSPPLSSRADHRPNRPLICILSPRGFNRFIPYCSDDGGEGEVRAEGLIDPRGPDDRSSLTAP